MKFISTSAIAATLLILQTAPGKAAVFSGLSTDVVKFDSNTSEADLVNLGAPAITFGNTKIYIGTRQTSSINQDPIVISFTNGVRNWVQSYDTSPVDARGVGLLWDEASASLYGVFTTDGGATGSNTFEAATQGGWLENYGSGGGAKASVLLKLNANTGNAEAGTFIRAELSSGRTNTVVPTSLDYVSGNVVFYGSSYFTPLGIDGAPLTNPTANADSPFPYRVVLSGNLANAMSAEAIGWNGVTQFSPLVVDDGNNGEEPPTDPDDGGVDIPDGSTDPGENPTDPGSGPIGGDDGGDDVESVPEPAMALGLGLTIAAATRLRKTRSATSQAA